MSNETATPGSLRASLSYDPQSLKFGTSGRRGEVIHLTQLEIYLNARAELDYLLSLSPSEGGIKVGQEFFFACDLRPSSTRFVPEQGGRGEIAQAIERAVADAGLKPANLGTIPTPALTSYALARGCGSIMVTGSHIPFDRNGYKTNSAKGELLKRDEAPINERVAVWRERLYQQPVGESLFTANGNLITSGGTGVSPVSFGPETHGQDARATMLPEVSPSGRQSCWRSRCRCGRGWLHERRWIFRQRKSRSGRQKNF